MTAETLNHVCPNAAGNVPAIIESSKRKSDCSSDREILYKVLFDRKSDLNDLKKLTMKLMQNGVSEKVKDENESLIQKIYGDDNEDISHEEEDDAQVKLLPASSEVTILPEADKYHFAEEIEEEETLSLHDKELELIKKSLERNKGKRKAAAKELGISERTLYRKIKQFDL